MKPINVQIITWFLLEEQKRFFGYLDDCSIDPNDMVKKEDTNIFQAGS